MKYTINHKELSRFIDIYLSMTEYDVIGGEFVNELVLRRKGSDGINDDYIYTYDDNRLLVETNLVWVVSGFFNIPEEDTLDYIGEWFENKYNLPVEEIIDWL